MPSSASANQGLRRMNYPVDQQDNWSALTPDTVLRRLGSSVTGLSYDEAARRLAQYGPNRLPSGKRRSALHRLLLQFHNVLLYVLLAASFGSAPLGHWVVTGGILSGVGGALSPLCGNSFQWWL